MGNEVKQVIEIKEVANVSDVLEGIKKIQKSLQDLAVPSDLQEGFDKAFSNVEKQVEKASKAMASGFKTKGSVEAYEQAMTQIVGIFDDLNKRVNRLGDKKIVLKVDDAPFKKLNAEIDALNDGLKKAEKNINNLKGLKSIDNLGSKTGNKVGSWDTFIKAYKDGDITGATNALRTLKGMLTKHDKDANYSKDTNWKNFSKDYEDAVIALNKLDKAQQEYTRNLNTKNAKEKEAAQYTARAASNYTQVKDAAQQGAQKVKEYAKSSTEAAEESRQLNSQLEQFRNKAAYFFGIANGINLLKRALRAAYATVKDLDAVMTETAVVTNFDVGDMWSQLPEYTQRANELGVTIHDTYEAATLFYQQGLKTNEVMQISNETLKMARIAGLDAATASDRMTNALRGFNMELDKTSAQRVNDVYSKLAAITASNTDEISTAMTKVASLAHNANMEFETTAAFLAQIIESTRESAETAGTALKTVVARFSEVKKLYSKGELMGQDEEGEEIDVNKVSTALRSAGINLNEYLTGAKGLDDIFIELAEKWDSLDQVQQRYIATMAAGSRQQSRFIALMSDYKRTTELVSAANNANGASQEQYSKTLESLQTKLARLKNAWNEFILGLANSDAIKIAVDMLTKLITAVNNLIKLISGKNAGVKMITSFFTAFAAFKIGSKLTGNKNPIANYFEALTETGAKKIALSAQKVATVYGGSLTNALKGELNNKKNNFLNQFKPEVVSTSYKIENINDFRKGIYQSDAWKNANSNQKIAINSAIQTGDVEKVNEALKQQGLQLEVNTKNEKQFGVTSTAVTKTTTEGWQAVSKAALVFGTVLIAAGDRLKDLGGAFETIGPIIKGLGTGLLVFGTIMSVTIPMMAQLGAAGVTAAIESIPIIGWITAVIAAVVALGAAIYNISKNKSAEAKLEKSAAAAEKAAQAADDARKSFNELNEAWDKLDDKKTAINELTEGTTEWKNAVKELNNEVMELANKYDGLQIKRNKNGILEIANQDEYTNIVRDQTLVAEGAARIGKRRQYIDEQGVAKKDYELEAAGFGEALTEVVNDYFKVGKVEELAAKTDEEIKELLNKKYEAYGIYGTIATANDQQAALLRDYAKKSVNNQMGVGSQNQAFGATVLESANVGKDLQKYANTFLSDAYINNLIEKNSGKYNRDSDKVIKRKYAQSRGEANWNAYVSKHSEDKDVSAEELQNRMASADALKEATAQVERFTSTLGTLNKEEKVLFGEGASGLTKEQANTLKGYDEERIKKLYEERGGDETYGENGFENYFKDWFQITIDEAVAEFDTSKYGSQFSSVLSENLTKGLTAETFKGFTENLFSVFTASGTDGVKEIQDYIEKNIDPKKQEAFIKALGKVDWTSANSVRGLSDLAKEYGISEDKANELEEQIIKLNNAATKVDLKKVTEQIKSLAGLAKKLQIGTQDRNFSEEQKNQLIEAGVSKDKFVYNIETGEYNYTGVLSEISSKITQLIKNTFDTKQIEKDIASGEAANEALSKGDENAQDKTEIVQAYRSLAKENSKISSEAFMAAWSKTQYGDYTDMDKLYAIIRADADSYEDNKQKLNDYNSEKEVMSRQLQYGFINAEDAVKGDEEARKALLAQISGTGLPEEIKQKLLTGMETNSGNFFESTRKAGNIVDTFDQARASGISAEDLNAYAEALKRVEGLQDAETDKLYALALAEAKYNAGMKSLVSSYGDWSKLIDKKNGNFKIPEPDTSAFKTYTKMKADVEKMLNSSKKIPDAFFEAKGNAELLEKAVKQDKKAIAELSTKLAKLNIGDFEDDELNKQVDAYLKKIQNDMPNFKIGAEFNAGSAELELAKLLAQSGKTVDEINKIMGNLGVNLEWEEKEMSYSEASEGNTTGYREIVKEDGTKTKVPINGETASDNETKVKVPMPKKATVAKRPKVNPPKTKKKSKGGGGGKKAKAKKERWDNPYDELYNLQEKINEALRKREALERRYQKLLKQEQSSLSDIRKSYYDQIKQIRTEASLQKELEAGRARQINNIGKETYVDSKGKVKTFDQMGVTKYAKYNFETGEIEMDWAGIQALEGSKNVEKGKAVEAYVSKLEELVKSYEDVRDKLWELEDKIEEYRQAVIDTFLSFEDRVLDAVINKYQKEIDSYQAMSDAIDKVNNEVLSSLREQIDLSRQIRDNTKKEEDISKKENRLAYLRRDTSGANDLEILSLEKELKDAREGYADTLVDQTIDKLQDDADKASEQRQRQIETMQAQLDIAKETGALWQEVYDLMQDAAKSEIFSSDSELAKLLRDGEAFKALSNIGQAKWWEEVGKSFREAIIGRDEAEDKYKTDADNNGTVANTGTSDYLKEIGEMNTQANVTADSYERTDEQNYGAAAAIVMGGTTHGGWGAKNTNWASNLKEKGFDPGVVLDLVDIFNAQKAAWDKEQTALQKKKGKYTKGKNKGKWKYTKKAWTGWKTMGVTDWKKYQMSQFKTGGLADTTGPAWLDGTKTNPELVLNAKDTRNFIALKDILASLMNTQKTKPSASSGDNYFDINIQADIGSDYDVDKLASRIKKIIFEDGQYRNVNTINYLR